MALWCDVLLSLLIAAAAASVCGLGKQQKQLQRPITMLSGWRGVLFLSSFTFPIYDFSLPDGCAIVGGSSDDGWGKRRLLSSSCE